MLKKNSRIKNIWIYAICAGALFASPAQSATSLTQHGITWVFDKDYPVGQYANGDYWVTGPVNIIAITNNFHTSGLLPAAGQDGSMINPDGSNKQGYDYRLTSYQASLNKALINGAPVSSTNLLTLPVASSLISSVSWLCTITGGVTNKEPGCPPINGGTGEPRPVLRSAAVLTCVSDVPPAGSFRPPYCGTNKTARFNKSQLDYSKLSNLTPVTGVPALTNIERSVERPWIDHVYEYLGAMVHPSENMPQYGREFSYAIGEAALMLNLDFTKLTGSPSKEKLLISFTQIGIDFAGIADAGGGWPSNGGHHMGRKWPILCAGVVLNDSHMKGVGSWNTEFQEDRDTFYVSQADVDITHSASWKPDTRADALWPYETNHIGLPEWGIRHTDDPWADNLHWTATYRVINNQAYPGWVLAALIMGQRTAWNHEPLFDYIDRSTSIIDPANPTNSNGYTTEYFGTAFMKNMWQTYRANYPPQWIPDDPTNIYGQGRLYYSMEITTGSLLPTGTVNEVYNQTLAAGGGKTPYTWAVVSGSLPSGLGLVAASGTITGTPATAVTANFGIKVTDQTGKAATNAFSLTIIEKAAGSVTTTNIVAELEDRCIGLNTNGIPVLGSLSQSSHNIADDNAAYGKANQCAIIMFKLPVLQAGETIRTANLALGINAASMSGGTDPLPKGVDIYGLRYATNTTVLTNDYGFKAVIGANDVLIQDNIVQFTSNITYNYTVYNTDTTGDAALAAWLNAQYTAGATGGNYAFLRIHADSQSANQIYITSANSTTNTPPTLTFGIETSTPSGNIDSDADGIPDEWEERHFGGAANVHPDALAANGINTIYETYIAGLNPTNSASVLLISDFRSPVSGNILQWDTVSGRVYSVYWATNLISGFQPMATNIVWPQNSWTNPAGIQSEGFYRLKVRMIQ